MKGIFIPELQEYKDAEFAKEYYRKKREEEELKKERAARQDIINLLTEIRDLLVEIRDILKVK